MTTISDSETEYKIIGLDPNEYPKIPQVGANQSLTIKDNVLKNMIYKTLFAVSQTSVQNPILCGSMFKIKDEFLNIVSVDGYRVRYKLIVGNCTSPISEAKNLTDFTKSEMEEIVKRTGISMASIYREETTEAVYVD